MRREDFEDLVSKEFYDTSTVEDSITRITSAAEKAGAEWDAEAKAPGDLLAACYPGGGGRWNLWVFYKERDWGASISGVEAREGNVLETIFGRGNTPEDAMLDYCRRVAGKTLVIGAWTDRRREVKV